MAADRAFAQTGWPVPNSIFAGAVAGRTTALAYEKNIDGMKHGDGRRRVWDVNVFGNHLDKR